MVKLIPVSYRALCFCFLVVMGLATCKKEKATPVTPPEKPSEDEVKPVPDPETAKTVGFFSGDWAERPFSAPAYTDVTPPASGALAITVDASSVIAKIPPAIFGHNANVWMTRMIDQPLFLTHLTNLRPNVVRFPAGSGSDAYFWNRPEGNLPADVPARLPDKDGILKDPGYFFGKVTNNWQASLDDYYATLQKTGSKGIITVNYGYARYGTSEHPVAAAAHLAAEWVRYDKGRTKYWEVGNENYGDWESGYRIDLSKNKDGQPEFLTGKLYGQHFKVFADSMKKAAREAGTTIYVGAVMYEAMAEAWRADIFKSWNSGMIPELADKNDYFIVHNYFTPYNQNSKASDILNAAYTVPATMMSFIKSQMKAYGATEKPVALTEWNMFAVGSKQQVSSVSGLFSVLVQGEAIRNQYGLAARWDLLNGWSEGDDHGLFSDGNEPGVAKWTPRPSFYYMYYFQKTIGDRMIPSSSPDTELKTYASSFSSGQVSVALVNCSTGGKDVSLQFKNFQPGSRFYWYSLEGGNDNAEFSRKVVVNGEGTSSSAGGPDAYSSIKARSALVSKGVRVTVPARGAVFLLMDKK